MPQRNNLRPRLYETMFRIRRVEETLMAEYHPADQMRCPMHFCIGQEAMPAALAEVMRPNDILMTHYRPHGYYLAKGAPLKAMIAEFYGKAAGSNGGLAGSMELGAHHHNYFSGAIVGGAITIPLGGAFAQKYKGTNDISIAVFGDGALDEGIVYECFNLAALYKLPLLMICENNKYAAHTAIESRMALPLLAERAQCFGLPTIKLDGNDSELLLSHLVSVVAGMRADKGPFFIEIETYRQCAHVGPSDDNALAYRPKTEIENWMQRDPVKLMREAIAEELSQSQISKIEGEVECEINEAIEFAKSAKFPNFETLENMNWSGEYAALIRNFTEDPTQAFDGSQSEARLEPF